MVEKSQTRRTHAASDGTSATLWALNPWRPMARPIDLKHIGKLQEELGEAGAACARCVIQGIEESEPVTGKPNREWLEDELADVFANIDLVVAHFGLDAERMLARADRKKEHLRQWHSMLNDNDQCHSESA